MADSLNPAEPVQPLTSNSETATSSTAFGELHESLRGCTRKDHRVPLWACSDCLRACEAPTNIKQNLY